MRKLNGLFHALLLLTVTSSAASWDGQVLPPEHHFETEENGATVIFATTHPADDQNLYFHNRCFLWKNSLMLFLSNRFGEAEIMGYFLETGELIRFNPPHADGAAHPLASLNGDRLYVIRQNTVCQWSLEISTSPKTRVTITETQLAKLPEEAVQVSGLAENCDASLLAFAYRLKNLFYIDVVDMSGNVRRAATLDFAIDHVQFHKQRPDLLSCSRNYGSDWAPAYSKEAHARFWFINVNTHVPVPAFYQVPGELVTHECWWVNDQITFIGGHHREKAREEGHVKVLDIKTGDIRIIGAGAWWEDGTAEQLAKVNWWHASGSPDGRWVAADNWHGIVALFDAKTTEQHILTSGHRVYGGGAHLHVGWDTYGNMVEFTSNKRGNPDVCIAILPKDW